LAQSQHEQALEYYAADTYQSSPIINDISRCITRVRFAKIQRQREAEGQAVVLGRFGVTGGPAPSRSQILMGPDENTAYVQETVMINVRSFAGYQP
jgi:hypothetical protein